MVVLDTNIRFQHSSSTKVIMNTIVRASIGLILSSYCLVGTAVAGGSVKAKYPLKSYIHPIGVLSVRESIGNNSTLPYQWKGIYRADPNHPKIKAELKKVGKSEYYGLGDAAVSVYDEQVESAGVKIDGRMTGILDYTIRDRQGRKWSVTVRGDRDFHSLESGEFTVFIGIPGG
jgi:hypothetical protein